MRKIFFKNQNMTAEVEDGTTILEAARKLGIVVEAPCNGMGTCGKCKVKVRIQDLAVIEITDDLHKVSEDELAEGYVLACQSLVHGDIEVEFESTAKQNESLKIVDEGADFQYNIDTYVTKKFNGTVTEVFADGKKIGEEQGDTTMFQYGVSVDIGTTTVVSSLVDMKKCAACREKYGEYCLPEFDRRWICKGKTGLRLLCGAGNLRLVGRRGGRTEVSF